MTLSKELKNRRKQLKLRQMQKVLQQNVFVNSLNSSKLKERLRVLNTKIFRSSFVKMRKISRLRTKKLLKMESRWLRMPSRYSKNSAILSKTVFKNMLTYLTPR